MATRRRSAASFSESRSERTWLCGAMCDTAPIIGPPTRRLCVRYLVPLGTGFCDTGAPLEFALTSGAGRVVRFLATSTGVSFPVGRSAFQSTAGVLRLLHGDEPQRTLRTVS